MVRFAMSPTPTPLVALVALVALCLACAALAGALALGVAIGARSSRRERSELASVVRQLSDETASGSVVANGRTLRRLIGHLPKWIKYADVDRVPWLNKAARQMWPSLDKAIAVSVVEALEPTLNDLAKSTGMSMNFKKFTCGVEPPILASVKVSTESEGEVILDIEFKWAAKDASIVLDVSTLGIKLPIEMNNVEAYGTFRLVFGPLVPWWPSFSALKLAFVDKPAIDFSLKLVGGDITAVPLVASMLRDLIKNQLVDLMVWPARLWCAVSDWQPDEVAHNSGLLRVTVHSASQLPGRLGMPPKAAVEVSLTQRADVKRSTTIKRGSDPIWEETFEFTVTDIHSAKLRLNVIDTRVTVGSTIRAPSALLNRSNTRGMSSKYDGEQLRANKPSIGSAMCDVSLCHDTPLQTVALQVPLVRAKDMTALSLAVAPLLYGAGLAKRALSIPTGGGSSPRASGPHGFNAPDGPTINISVSYHPFKKREQPHGEAAAHPPKTVPATTMVSAETDNKMMMEQFSGVLYVRLLRGENLAGVGEAPDPFVKMRMNRQKRKSSTKFNTRQPVWEEEFEFIIGEQELENSNNILLEVWDRDAFGVKTSLGHLELDTRAVLSRCTLIGTPVEEVFELTNTPSGSLTFEFEFLSVLLHPEVKEDVAERVAEEKAREKKTERKPSTLSRMTSRMFSRKKKGLIEKKPSREDVTTYGSPIVKQVRSTPVPRHVETADSPLVVSPRSPTKKHARTRSKLGGTPTDILQEQPHAAPQATPQVTVVPGKKPGVINNVGKRVRSVARSTGRALSVKKADEGGNIPVTKEAGILSPRRQPTRASEIVPGLEWRQKGIAELHVEKTTTVAAFETPQRSMHKRSVSVPDFATPTLDEELAPAVAWPE